MIMSEKRMRTLIKEVLAEAFKVGSIGEFRGMSDSGAEEGAESKSGEEWQGEEVESPIKTSTSSSVVSSAAQRAEELGNQLGIDPAWIYAEEAKESSHIPNAMAFNGDNFIGFLNNDEEKVKKALAAGFKKSDQAFYGSNAGKAFAAAYQIDKIAAIKAGAWGLYQVLGRFSLPTYGNDPDAWTDAFKSDPVQHSKRALKAWIESYGSEFKKAVNDGNYAYTTRKYYGAPNPEYERFIRNYVAKYRDAMAKQSTEETDSTA